jgi:hypothetical protein
MSRQLESQSLTLEDGLIELRNGGGESLWIWAQTCPTPNCLCRSAVVLASRSGNKNGMLSAATVVRERFSLGLSMQDLEERIGDDCAAFDLDIDTAEARRVKVNRCNPLLLRYPWLTGVLDRIDGDTLESLAGLWYRGKARPLPDTTHQPIEQLSDWEPGQEVSWVEAYSGIREDCFPADGKRYEAFDLYCVDPDCDCGRVSVRFDDLEPKEPTLVGVVTIEKSGECALETLDGPMELLERLWASFVKRHPRHRERHALRYPRMKAFGALLFEQHRRLATKARPNEPCPCGSGKKYKKCCWKRALAH